MGDADDHDRYRAPALDKGLDILELLAAEDGAFTQIEIAKALGRTPNEIYRMLDRLVRRGYVSRNASDRYELTLKMFGLAHLHRPVRRLVSQAAPLMRSLAARSLQANHLAVYDRAGVYVIAQMDAPGYWGIAIRVGARVSLFNTGSGHVLLAYRTPEERAMMVAEQEEAAAGPVRLAELEPRLADIRERGYEIMPSQQTAGVHNLSAPVPGPDGQALAALTCPYLGRLNRAEAPDVAQTVRMLCDTAATLALAMGGVPAPARLDGVLPI